MEELRQYVVVLLQRRVAWLQQNRNVVAKVLVSVAVVAWVLARTSGSWWGNLPAAALLLLGVRWLLLQAEYSHKARTHLFPPEWHQEDLHGSGSSSKPVHFVAADESIPNAQHWRKNVKSPVVEHAWEALCGSIIQEFIYDTWYASLTPDKEFPADVRRLLNGAFGHLAGRARHLDLRAMLNDMSELLMEQIELFRDTRDSILSSHGPAALINMTPAARERAYRQEMRAENNLHPALQTPEGHYKFLKAVSEGLVAQALDDADLQSVATRVICRELVAGAVLRPLLMWCTPYFANKALYTVLQSEPSKSSSSIPDSGISSAMAAARSQQMRGHFEFEQRIRKNAAAEDLAVLAARVAKPDGRRLSRTSHHQKLPRSRSWDALLTQAGEKEQSVRRDDLSASLPGSSISQNPQQSPQERQEAEGHASRLHTETNFPSPNALDVPASLPQQPQRRAVTSPAPSLELDVQAAGMQPAPLPIGSCSALKPPLSCWPPAESLQHAGSSQPQHVPHASLHHSSQNVAEGLRRPAGCVEGEDFDLVAEQRCGKTEHPVQEAESKAELLVAATLLSSSPLSLPMPGAYRNFSAAAGARNKHHPGTAQEQSQHHWQAHGFPASSSAFDAEMQEWEHVVPTDKDARCTAFLASSGSPCDTSGPSTRVHGVAAEDDVPQTQQTPTKACDSLSGHLLASAADTTRVESSFASSTSQKHQDNVNPVLLTRPRAKVVAADLISSGSKDYVVYKIRVSDGFDEWTVSRRFRNFETLHKQMKMVPGYRLKIPGKRIFTHSQNVDFVEERRDALDHYLQAALSCDILEGNNNLWEFLRNGSDVYELQPSTGFFRGRATAKSSEALRRRKSLISDHSVSRALAEQWKSKGRAMVPQEDSGKGCHDLDSRQHSRSVPWNAVRVNKGMAGEAVQQAPVQNQRQQESVLDAGAHYSASVTSENSSSSTAVPIASIAVNREGLGSNQPREQAEGNTAGVQRLQRQGDGSPRRRVVHEDSRANGGAAQDSGTILSSKSLAGLSGSKAAGLLSRASKKAFKGVSSANLLAALSRSQSHSDMAGSMVEGGSLSGSPPKKGIFRRNSRASSPVKGMQKQSRVQGNGSSPASMSFTSSNASKSFLESSPRPPTLPPSPDPAQHHPGKTIGSPGEALGTVAVEAAVAGPSEGPEVSDMADCVGISAPLYEIVDCVFQLQTRGFFRRQVFGVARQVLSLVAGDAIDVYLLSRLKLLRQAHTIARILQSIQGSLWPGGVWFQHLPQYQVQQAEQPKQGTPSRDIWAVQADKYLDPWGPPPLDEDEIREAVYNLLMSRAPSPLVRLVGRNAYISGIEDLFGMLQSSTFVQQLGYGLLHIAVIHMFPELKQLLARIEREGVC